MNKIFRILLKVLKWGLIVLFGFYFLMIIIFGFKTPNLNGTHDFYWSGMEALWQQDEDFGFWLDKEMEARLDGIDGPYVVGNTVYSINEANFLFREQVREPDSLIVRINNKEREKFTVKLRHRLLPVKANMEMPEKLVAISDIEGNFNGFSSFLQANKIMDKKYNWIFGQGHLFLNGDFVDRGGDVRPVLWLIYRLEQQAFDSGGRVHFILGNHELMNLQGKWGYNQRKYIKAAQMISGEKDWDKAVRYIYSSKTELGKWLRSKNVIEKAGNYIFVHGGLNPRVKELNLSIPRINTIVRNHINKELDNNQVAGKTATFLLGSEGPLWFRGLATGKVKVDGLARLLDHLNAKKIVIGHTVVDHVSTGYNGKVIYIDVKHGSKKNTGKTRGILIENGTEYIIDDLVGRWKL